MNRLTRRVFNESTLWGGLALQLTEYVLMFLFMTVPCCWIMFMCYHDDGDNEGDYVVNERTEA